MLRPKYPNMPAPPARIASARRDRDRHRPDAPASPACTRSPPGPAPAPARPTVQLTPGALALLVGGGTAAVLVLGAVLVSMLLAVAVTAASARDRAPSSSAPCSRTSASALTGPPGGLDTAKHPPPRRAGPQPIDNRKEPPIMTAPHPPPARICPACDGFASAAITPAAATPTAPAHHHRALPGLPRHRHRPAHHRSPSRCAHDRHRHPAGLDPTTLGDLLRVAGSPGFDRWHDQIRRTGGCANPIHLTGWTLTKDKTTGETLHHYSTETEPGGRLRVACGNRRASRCPSCAWTYAGDTYHLIRAGLAGDDRRDIPATVRDHPRVFATLTAPSFGPVHNRPDPGLCRCGTRHPDGRPGARHRPRPETVRLRGRRPLQQPRRRPLDALHQPAPPRDRRPRRPHPTRTRRSCPRSRTARSPSSRSAAPSTSTP